MWGIYAREELEFIDEASGKATLFSFEGIHHTYQVERSVFDEKLFNNAVQHGVICAPE